MSRWSELKFTQQELDAKNITGLADRPALSAEEMKQRLDSGDIRVRLNALLDALDAAVADGEI